MPSTARLFRADGDAAIHAHRPDEDRTLCGLLSIVDPEDYEVGDVPPRSADYTGRRFYIGVTRLMCGRCTTEAAKVRLDHEALSVRLEEVRAG